VEREAGDRLESPHGDAPFPRETHEIEVEGTVEAPPFEPGPGPAGFNQAPEFREGPPALEEGATGRLVLDPEELDMENQGAEETGEAVAQVEEPLVEGSVVMDVACQEQAGCEDGALEGLPGARPRSSGDRRVMDGLVAVEPAGEAGTLKFAGGERGEAEREGEETAPGKRDRSSGCGSSRGGARGRGSPFQPIIRGSSNPR